MKKFSCYKLFPSAFIILTLLLLFPYILLGESYAMIEYYLTFPFSVLAEKMIAGELRIILLATVMTAIVWSAVRIVMGHILYLVIGGKRRCPAAK